MTRLVVLAAVIIEKMPATRGPTRGSVRPAKKKVPR